MDTYPWYDGVSGEEVTAMEIGQRVRIVTGGVYVGELAHITTVRERCCWVRAVRNGQMLLLLLSDVQPA